MNWLFDFIVASIPWYIWTVGLVVLAIAAWRLIGWQGILAVGATALAIFGYKRGQSVEHDRILEKANKDADKAIAKAKRARDAATRDGVRDDAPYKRD